MLSATRRWLRRHRTPVAIGVGVIGAGYIAGQYVMNKISETRERFTSERTARENLRRRFEQNQTDCTFTVLALLPTATEHILEDLPVEQITAELHQLKARRQSRLSQSEPGTNTDAASSSRDQQAQGQDETQNQEGPRSESFVHASQAQSDAAAAERPAPAKKRTRVQIWNELKITSITRAFTMAYTLTLLMLLTRIQLNLLGRRSYLASVVSLATPHPASSGISLEDHDDDFKSVFSNDHELNRQYLTFSWWLLNRGYKDLMQRVRDAVEQVFGPINIREDISQERLSELAVEVRKRVEGATNEDRKEMRWLPYMLPPRDLEASVFTESGVANDPEFTSATTADILAAGTPLRALLDETSDLIDSPTFSHIASLLNNVAFTYFFDKRIAPIVFEGTDPASPPPAPPSNHSDAQSLPSSVNLTAPAPAASRKIPLHSLLAPISRETRVIGAGADEVGGGNEYLAFMEENVRELEAFAAVVYSNNLNVDEFQREGLVTVPEEGEAQDGEGEEEKEEKDPEAGRDRDGDGEKDLSSAFEDVWGQASRRSSH